MAKAIKGGINPFTSGDIALAKQVIESADLALELYAKCPNCTIDVSPLIEQVKSYKAAAEGIVREFEGSASE